MTENEMKNAADRLYAIIVGELGKVCSDDSIGVNEDEYIAEGYVEATPFKVYLKVGVHSENGLVTIFSVLPFEVPQKKADEYARLICQINYSELYAGSFDYSPEAGKVVFRMALPYRYSLLSKELVQECLNYCVQTVSSHNEKLFEATRE